MGRTKPARAADRTGSSVHAVHGSCRLVLATCPQPSHLRHLSGIVISFKPGDLHERGAAQARVAALAHQGLLLHLAGDAASPTG